MESRTIDFVADYINSIIAPRVRRRRRPVSSGRSISNVDSAAFWRTKFEELKQACLLNGVIPSEETASPAISSSGRSRNPHIRGKSNRQRRSVTRGRGAVGLSQASEIYPEFDKGEQVSPMASTSTMSCLDTIGNNPPVSHQILADNQGDQCLHHIFDIAQARADEAIKLEQLSFSFSRLSHHICRYILALAKIPPELHASPTSPSNSPILRLNGLIRHFGRLTFVIERAAGHAKMFNVAIHDSISVCEALLHAMGQTETSKVEASVSPPDGTQIRPTNGHTRTTDVSNQPAGQTKQHPGGSNIYATLLIGFLEALSAERSGHHEVFEGFLAVLLETVGVCLKWAMDDKEQPRDSDDGIRDMTAEGRNADTHNISSKVPGIVLLLRHVMQLAQHFPKLGDSLNDGPAAGHLQQASSASGLSMIAYKRALGTVFKATFGSEANGLASFQAVHINPDASDLIIESPNLDPKHSFKRDVCKIFGWDIIQSILG